jgi:hypothetical protein
MKIRMKIQISGTVENNPNGVQIGDIVDVPDDRALHYLQLQYAEPVVDIEEERAVAPAGEERAEPRRRRTTAKHTDE